MKSKLPFSYYRGWKDKINCKDGLSSDLKNIELNRLNLELDQDELMQYTYPNYNNFNTLYYFYGVDDAEIVKRMCKPLENKKDQYLLRSQILKAYLLIELRNMKLLAQEKMINELFSNNKLNVKKIKQLNLTSKNCIYFNTNKINSLKD